MNATSPLDQRPAKAAVAAPANSASLDSPFSDTPIQIDWLKSKVSLLTD
jgi:hypothetical protein